MGDAPEGLDKRQVLVESDMMLAEFDYKRAKYKVVVYEEPVMLVAQWMEDDGTWRLLKSVEAELVEDAIAYQQLQVRSTTGRGEAGRHGDPPVSDGGGAVWCCGCSEPGGGAGGRLGRRHTSPLKQSRATDRLYKRA